LNPTASRTACSCSTASSCDEGPFGIKVSIVRAGLSRTIQSKVQQDAITRQHKAALLATGMLIHCLYWYLAGAQQEAPVSCWHSLQAHAGHSDAHLPCRDLECNSSYLCSSPTHMPSRRTSQRLKSTMSGDMLSGKISESTRQGREKPQIVCM